MLDLSNNQLTGSCQKLTLLEFVIRVYHSRDSCAGPIPTDIGQLVSLKVLGLSSNQLTGKHPSAHICQNGKRVYHHSKILLLCAKGSIPTQIGNLRQFKKLWFNQNQVANKHVVHV